jgi:hypothetical protein
MYIIVDTIAPKVSVFKVKNHKDLSTEAKAKLKVYNVIRDDFVEL